MISNYLTEKLLKAITGKASSASTANEVYIALSNTEPLPDGTNVTEPSSSNGYARVLLGNASQTLTQKIGDPIGVFSATETVTLTVSTDTIASASIDFEENFIVGDTVEILGSSDNDGHYIVATVASGSITVEASPGLPGTDETASITIKNLSGGKATNTEIIYFPEVVNSDWPTCNYYAVYDAPTGGNLYYAGKITSPPTPQVGQVTLIQVGELDINLR